MTKHSCERDRQGSQGRRATPSGARSFTEPEMRRWPHPVDGTPPASEVPNGQIDISLHYIHCAISYQNQLLAEIKSALEQLILNLTPAPEEK